MFNDEDKPSALRRFLFLTETKLIYNLSLKKKFSSIGSVPMVWGIRNVVVYGPDISIGERVLIVAAPGYRTTLTTVSHGKGSGRIAIGNDVLVMNGVRVSSAGSIDIGDECMLANFCYVMDSDWHDIYNRGSVPGSVKPVTLERNVWIGDSAIICKGVTIGENSIIGAGAVVTKDVPANVVAAGNPARIVKKLDKEKIVLKQQVREEITRTHG
jgi:acetyltransferase-like isoleucine patch superfamily enzyme